MSPLTAGAYISSPFRCRKPEGATARKRLEIRYVVLPSMSSSPSAVFPLLSVAVRGLPRRVECTEERPELGEREFCAPWLRGMGGQLRSRVHTVFADKAPCYENSHGRSKCNTGVTVSNVAVTVCGVRGLN